MCGIFGWIGETPQDPRAIECAVGPALHHRGPDDQGFLYAGQWGLGFRRLSILDLSPLGRQPMCTPDRQHWLVFNGEIYNYLELRAELDDRGEVFASQSDSEVLLRLLAIEGPRAIPRLNGMFAFAYLDLTTDSFILARDRLGVKPLYYSMNQLGLRFASELKGLLAWPGAGRQINPQAVIEFLALNYLSTETCIFQDYQKLPPAAYLTGPISRPQQSHIEQYWSVEINGDSRPSACSQTDLDKLQELVADSVRIRLRSDVPVGVFLSGGIDSGLVAAVASQQLIGQQPIQAITIGYAEQSYDETDLASATADYARLRHLIIPQPAASLNQLDELAGCYDEPFGDESALPTYNLCRAAAQHGTVYLTGDGGDESFAGYRRYIESLRYSALTKLPKGLKTGMRAVAALLPIGSTLRYQLLKAGLPDQGFAAAFDHIPQDPLLGCLLHPDLLPWLPHAGAPLWTRWEKTGGKCLTARQQALDISLYLPDDILVKMDRASMAHSIEVRSPFLDYRIVEWAAKQPRTTLLNGSQGKLPLRMLAKRLLPASVQSAAKRGFGVPLDRWFSQAAGIQFARERLLSPGSPTRRWLNQTGVQQVVQMMEKSGGRDVSRWIWRLLVLDAWARKYAAD